MAEIQLTPAPAKSAAELGPIGLGCVTFGREIDQAAAFKLMDHARARGVSFFDTAAAYADGASERVVGAWLAALPAGAKRPMIATKLLPPYDPERIKTTLAASLSRLGLDSVDLLYLHRWDASGEDPATLKALDALVREGKARMLGASNFTAEQLGRSLELQAKLGLARFQVLQNNHNFAVRDVTPPMRALCAAHGICVVTYSPLGAGFLTGKHRNGVAPGSRFDIMPGHQRVYFNDLSYARLARLEALAQRTGRTMTELALAWALHQPGGATVLIGGRSTAHIDQAFDALAIDVPELFADADPQ